MSPNEVTVLYSEGGAHASQAWVALKVKGFDNVYSLLGGFAGWKREVLYPELMEEKTNEERRANEQRRALSIFFGGQPKNNGGSSSQTRSLPRKPSKPKPVPQKDSKEDDKLLRYHCSRSIDIPRRITIEESKYCRTVARWIRSRWTCDAMTL